MPTASLPLRLVGWLCLAVILPTNALGQPPLPHPTEVWVRGSDIETSEHSLTLRLRDALEAALDVKADTVGVADPTIVWLSEDVRIEGRKFIYRALLANKQLRVLRTSTGECDGERLDACARAILHDLDR